MGLEAMCLAVVMYLEARSDGVQGMKTVGEVVLARKDDRRWPNTICGVVMESNVDATGTKYCQFESICKHGTVEEKHIVGYGDKKAWKQSKNIAKELLSTDTNYNDEAKWFVANWIPQPSWTKSLCVEKMVGDHIFYKDCS